jgi:hypothetical protein
VLECRALEPSLGDRMAPAVEPGGSAAVSAPHSSHTRGVPKPAGKPHDR